MASAEVESLRERLNRALRAEGVPHTILQIGPVVRPQLSRPLAPSEKFYLAELDHDRCTLSQLSSFLPGFAGDLTGYNNIVLQDREHTIVCLTNPEGRV